MLTWCATTLPSTMVATTSLQAGMRLELIFAGLEILARLEHQHAADEDPGLVDDAFAVEHIGDVAHARSRAGY